jgi:GWxTD domain-containing protein
MCRFGQSDKSSAGCFSLRVLFLIIFFLLDSGSASFGQKPPKLEKNYREWLERDVVYLINKEERDAFRRLATNEARDKFIEDFWEIRNPNPGSPTNTYRDEVYQRIAFADARFSIGSGMEGWRTDRGRTYITLGPPQQKQVFRNSGNLYPIEIWFYGGANPALPPFFYVMFYQREGSGDYRFYSPYTDGPDKLATGVEAINSRAAALKMIRDSAGPEVARISLTLLPDEPVDEATGITSLESDILLNSIKNLPNMPANREEINRRRALRETVTSRIILEGRNLSIITFPARDSRGLTRLDYAVRLQNPSDLSMTQESDGGYRYTVEVRVRVFTPDNKLIFTQQKTVSESISKKHLDSIKDKIFGYESMLPLPPGKYRLDFQLTDWSKKTAFHTAREVMIPTPPKEGLIVPGVLPFISAENVDPGLADLLPFSLGGIQFTPASNGTPTLAPDTNLQVVYQIWAPPQDPRTRLGKTLEVQYDFGMPASPGSTRKVKDQIGMEQFDTTGSLVTGKKLSLEKQSMGNYILNVSVNDPATKQNGFATMNFKVLDTSSLAEVWDVVEPGIAQDAEKGILDQQRGLSHLAFGQVEEARVWFRRALQLDHADDIARARLVDAYFSRKDYAAVVTLFSDAGVTEKTDSETLLRIATSFQKQGNTLQAISVIEAALQSRPEEGPLYLALAQYYGTLGNSQKAAELTTKGKSYLSPVPPKPQ